MAKYGRFDPRNKKNGRNKNRSLSKDFKIKEVEDRQHRFKITNIEWNVSDEFEEEVEQISQVQ